MEVETANQLTCVQRHHRRLVNRRFAFGSSWQERERNIRWKRWKAVHLWMIYLYIYFTIFYLLVKLEGLNLFWQFTNVLLQQSWYTMVFITCEIEKKNRTDS